MSLHERVARTMAKSHSVGSYHSYETILAALLAKCPTEAELRAHVVRMVDELPWELCVNLAGEGMTREQMVTHFCGEDT